MTLYFRLVPVFPAAPGPAASHERARVFPAARVERMNAQRSPLEVKNLTMMELSHFRLAAVEQPPARFARRPPDSGGLKRFDLNGHFKLACAKSP